MVCFQVNGLNIGSNQNVPFEADYIRMFNYLQSATKFIRFAENYDDARVAEGTLPVDRLTPGVVFVGSFDSSATDSTVLTIFDENGNSKKSSCSAQTYMFVTSTVPVKESFEAVAEPLVSYSEQVTSECVDAFNNSALLDNCAGKLGDATESFLWDTCLSAVYNNHSAQNVSDLFAAVCVATTDVDECAFNGTMGMCENDVSALQQRTGEAAASIPLPAVAGAAAAGLVAATLLLIYLIRRKLKGKKSTKDEGEEPLENDEDLDEDDLESAPANTAPMATAFIGAPKMPKQPKQPAKNSLWRYDKEDMQDTPRTASSQQPAQLPKKKPPIDPIKKKENEAKLAKTIEKLKQDLDVHVDDEEYTMMKNLDREKSLGSIALSERSSMASPTAGQGQGSSNPDFNDPHDDMFAATPMPMPGKSGSVGAGQGAGRETPISQQLPTLQKLISGNKGYQESSQFNPHSRNIASDVRKYIGQARKTSQPRTPEGSKSDIPLKRPSQGMAPNPLSTQESRTKSPHFQTTEFGSSDA